MVSSLGVSIVLLALSRAGMGFSTHEALVLTVIATTICWVSAAYLGPQTDLDVLIAFYRKVRPSGPGWAKIRQAAGIRPDDPTDRAAQENIPQALLGWVVGCTSIWSALFMVGSFLYGRYLQAWLLAAVFALSTGILISIVRRLWTTEDSAHRLNPYLVLVAVPSIIGANDLPSLDDSQAILRVALPAPKVSVHRSCMAWPAMLPMPVNVQVLPLLVAVPLPTAPVLSTTEYV